MWWGLIAEQKYLEMTLDYDFSFCRQRILHGYYLFNIMCIDYHYTGFSDFGLNPTIYVKWTWFLSLTAMCEADCKNS